MPSKLQPKIDELYHRIDKTSRDRYLADKRLKLHESWSVWTVTTSSILLIVFALLDGFNLQSKLSDSWLSVVQIMLAIFILAYSLIINTKSYALRAHKMHSCGLELSDLLFRVHSLQEDQGASETFEVLRIKYAEILSRFENHEEIDHQKMKLSKADEYKLTCCQRAKIRIKSYLEFGHYILLLSAELAVIIYTFS